MFPPEESTTDALVADQQVANEDVKDKVINLSEHPPESIRYIQKPSLQELISSSQSTILPTNALHLHLDDDPSTLTTSHESPYTAPDVTYDLHRPQARVRFRSRVRITSGFNRHRRVSDPGGISSTRSSSPSSSISAPLRTHTDSRTTTWGTLGQRVGLLSLQKKTIGSPQLQQRQRKRIRPMTSNDNIDERTPLRGSSNLPTYQDGESIQAGDISDEDEGDDRLSEEVDEIFGKFPGRLLNYHVCRLRFLPLCM